MEFITNVKNMRLGLITQEYAGIGQVNGGLGNYLTRVTTYLQGLGHCCEVFIFNPYEFPDGPGEVSLYRGARINKLATRHPSASLFNGLQLVEDLIPVLVGAWRVAEAVEAPLPRV